MKHFKYAFLPVFAIVFIFASINISAQEKEKSDLKKKLSELKGKVEKITVTVDGKEVVFEGKDAQALAKKMRTTGPASFAYTINGSKSKAKAYHVITRDIDVDGIDDAEALDEDVTVTLSGTGDSDKATKKIIVKKNDGKTKLTITTTDKDGKEVVKELDGEEAEKYLKENDEGVVYISSGKAHAYSHSPAKVKIIRARPSKAVIIEGESLDDDDDTATATEIYIEKGDKAKKEVIVKKKKAETKKIEKED